MRTFLRRGWHEDDGVLTFEWITLASLITIGVVGGVAVVRDALIDELTDVAEAMVSLDQSYTIDFPLAVWVGTPGQSGVIVRTYNPQLPGIPVYSRGSSASDSSFTDTKPKIHRGTAVDDDATDKATPPSL
jgi:Flp pilus assembly pilin Flp